MSILLKNCRYIITQNKQRQVIENQDILIKNNLIEKIGKITEEADEVIDCSEFIAMPGLINMHTHSSMNIMKGIAEELPFFKWLDKLIQTESKLTKKELYEGALLACREMIRTGTTTFNDMYTDLEQTVKAVKETGIRAYLSWGIVDEDKTNQKGNPLNNAENFIKQTIQENNKLIKAGAGPHAIYSTKPELIKQSKKLANKYNTFMHIHASETRKEVKDCYYNYNMRVIELLDSINVLDENTCLAHVGWITKKEAKIISEKKATVILNPTSNMKLGTGGNPPLPELLKYGANVTIGTDSTVSNNSLDMFEAMKYTALLQKHMRWDSSIITAQQVIDFATINAAKFLKLNAGSIEEGKIADLILIDLKEPNLQPINNIIANIVYSANGNCVNTTIINGKIKMKNKSYLF